MVTVDLTKNKKQSSFFYAVIGAVARHAKALLAKALQADAEAGKQLTAAEVQASQYKDPAPFRIFAYGGAIRGGKTFICLFILVLLCKRFPGSRWHVIRASIPDIIRNTEPSMKRILGAKLVRWKRSSSEFYVQFANGSRIYFMAENIKQDRDLDRFKGLETNGVLLEQAEELQHATFQKCLERAGSWYLPKMPPAFVFLTFNPAYNWVRDIIQQPAKKNELKCPFYYESASPKDNPYVTQDQYDIWSNLDSRTYARFIEGEWDIELEGRFMWAFSERKHVGRPEYDHEWPLYMSYDFNVDPSCAIVFQTDKESWFRVLKEYRIPNGDTYRLCQDIFDDWDALDPYWWVCGDAAGHARMSGTRGAVSQYNIIQEQFGIPWERFLVPRSNPRIADSRVLTNSVVQKLPEFVVHEECRFLVHDLNFVVIRRLTDGGVEIQKTGVLPHAPLNAKSMGHLLDTVRYGMHVTLPNFVRLPRS